MTKIIFVHPPLDPFQRYGHLGRVVDRLQPLNLCYLASSVRQAGLEAEIIDSQALELGMQETARLIASNTAQFVGITASTCSVENAGLLATAIKKHNPDTTVILGGVHVSALPETTMQSFPDIDVGVIGEGESVIVNLLNTYEQKNDLSAVKGIIFRKHKELIMTPRQPLIENLDSLPAPAWDLLPDFSRYIPSPVRLQRLPMACLVTSRGCNRACVFCDNSVFGCKIRAHSPEYVINIIRFLHENYRIKEIVFKDPDFVFSKPRALKFCDMLVNSDIHLQWNCMVRIDNLDREILSAMKSAGCWQIALGIESGSQKILDFLKKGLSIEKIKDSIELAKSLKFNIVGYIMIGSPLETEDTLRETQKLLEHLPIDSLKVNFFTPYPGSAIYKEIENFGYFREIWSRMNASSPLFIPFGLDKKIIVNYSKCITKQFYLRPRIVKSYLKRLLASEMKFKYVRGLLDFRKFIFDGYN